MYLAITVLPVCHCGCGSCGGRECCPWSPRLQPACCCKPRSPQSPPGPSRAETQSGISCQTCFPRGEFKLSFELNTIQIFRKEMYHIDAAMLPIVDLVVPYDGAAVGSDLDSRQGVTIDVVTLYQTSSISKYVHASLVTVENSISPRNKTKQQSVLE